MDLSNEIHIVQTMFHRAQREGATTKIYGPIFVTGTAT